MTYDPATFEPDPRVRKQMRSILTSLVLKHGWSDADDEDHDAHRERYREARQTAEHALSVEPRNADMLRALQDLRLKALFRLANF